jgi:hypothetical protein
VTANGPEPRPPRPSGPHRLSSPPNRSRPGPAPPPLGGYVTGHGVWLGRGRGEATRNIYYSVRRLPPGHDPGAACGEAPDGRQRGSRPCNILVEGRGGDRPRHEEREERIRTVEMNLTGRRRPDPTSRSSGRAEAQRSRPQLRPRCKTGSRRRDHVDHGARGVTCPPPGRVTKAHRGTAITAVTAATATRAGTRLPCSRRSRRPRRPMPPGERDESLLSHAGHGRHGGPGGHGASQADPDDHGGHEGLIGAVTARRATRRRRVTARARRSRRSRREPASQRLGDPKRGWPGCGRSATHHHFPNPSKA